MFLPLLFVRCMRYPSCCKTSSLTLEESGGKKSWQRIRTVARRAVRFALQRSLDSNGSFPSIFNIPLDQTKKPINKNRKIIIKLSAPHTCVCASAIYHATHRTHTDEISRNNEINEKYFISFCQQPHICGGLGPSPDQTETFSVRSRRVCTAFTRRMATLSVSGAQSTSAVHKRARM